MTLIYSSRFISESSISLGMLQALNKRQKCLKRMKFTWDNDWDLEPKSQRPCGEALPIFDGLLALDIYLKASAPKESSTHMERLVEAFFVSNPSLERLHVGACIKPRRFQNETIPDDFAKALSAAAGARPITFPKLKEFAIFNMKFSSGNAGYWHPFIPFEKLQRLSIFWDSEEDSLINYLDDVFSDDQLSLTHLRVDIQTDDVFSDDQLSLTHLGDDNAIPLLGSCKPLESLHIMTSLKDFEKFMTSLRKHGEALHTLAIAQYYTPHPTITRIGEEDFKELCQVCHNLHFLGVELSAEQLGPTYWATNSRLRQRLNALASIQGLRLIHFRVTQMIRYAYGDDSRKTYAQTSMEMEEFARRVFESMDAHSACVHLRSIVVGGHYYDNEKYCGGRRCYPRHCFIKENQPDEMGIPKIVAKQVPAYRIRDMEPDCDLFEFDPRAD